jgi:adenylate cyclase
LSAVQCAIDIQKDLAKLNEARPKDQCMQFRIGINVGDVMVKDGDIFGDGVNIAARLEGLADAGGICISRGIHDQVMRKLPYNFEDLGEQKVKNIARTLSTIMPLAASAMANVDSQPSERLGRTPPAVEAAMMP